MTDWVRLNVGGTMFETTRTTLTSDRDSILAKMFDPDSDRAAASVNQDGVFLIDACPRAFAVILNWLRYKDVILSKDIRAEEVIPVANYFGLDALCEKLKKLTNIYSIERCLWMINNKLDDLHRTIR